MISVLVPVFHVDVHTLVSALLAQAAALNGPCEIIVADDASASAFRHHHAALTALPGLRFIQLEKNLGRLRIRQRLAQEALYPWLLFLDSDSRLPDPLFLQRYAEALSNPAEVLTGGRLYDPQPPPDCRYRLHWTYGSRRENVFRHRTAFQTNNFCIHQQAFAKLNFDQDWKGYGHEDTWIGIQLENLGITVRVIRNPVVHEGLETAAVFLQKTGEALRNLPVLAGICGTAAVSRQVRLYRTFLFIKRWKLRRIYVWAYGAMAARVRGNLFSCRPSLRLFDLYRLYLLLRR